MSPGVVAPDVQVPKAPTPLPSGHVVWPGKPLIVETNARSCSVAILNGSCELVEVDGYGATVGAAAQLVVGTPAALGGGGRWRITFDGSSGDSSPLVFT